MEYIWVTAFLESWRCRDIMNFIIVKEYVGLILLLSSNQNYQAFAII